METSTSGRTLDFNVKQTTISGNKSLNRSVDTSTTQTFNKSSNASTETLDLSLDATTSQANTTNESKGVLESIGDGLKETGANIAGGFKAIGDWFSGGLKSIGSTLSETAANVGDNINSMISALGEWLDGTPIATALGTAAVVVGSAISGVVNIFEGFADGIYWAAGKLGHGVMWGIAEVAGLFGNEEAKENFQQTGRNIENLMKETIEEDLSGIVHSWAFNTPLGSWLNKNSLIKYDSELAQKISGGTEIVAKFAAATALTIATGGAAAPVAFAWVFGTGMLVGLGQNAEKVYTTKEESDWKDEIGILIRGAGEGLNWYAQGKLGSGLWKGLHAAKQIGFGESVNLIKGAAQNAWTTLKTQGLKTTLSNALTKENLLNAAHKAIFDSDNLRDSLAIAGDNVAAWVTGEEEFNLESLSKAVGEVLLVYGTSTLTDAFLNGAFNKRVDNLKTREQGIHDGIRDFAGNYADPNRVDAINNSFVYQNPESFHRSSETRNWTGYNNGTNSVILVGKNSDSVIGQTMLHESVHQSSHGGRFIDSNNITWSRAGVSFDRWDPTTKSWIGFNDGINESITEYFTQLIMGDSYQPGHCGYEPAVTKLKQMVDLGILDLDELKEAYFTNKPPIIIKKLGDILTAKGYSNVGPSVIIEAFNDAISSNVATRNKGLMELTKWIKKLV